MSKPNKQRIIGIDVARALAVIGMIVVNFKVVFGEVGDGGVKLFANFFAGKAAATFVVLAGVGLALMTNTAVKTQNQLKLKMAQKRILKRAIFLFVIGLSYTWIWVADILHFYGVYMLLTLFFITKSSKQILISVLGAILIYPVLVIFFDYEKGWILKTLHYTDFWTLKGSFRNLFFNGFHPVIPWVSFMLFGLWFGKQNLHDTPFLKKALGIGTTVFITIQVISQLYPLFIVNPEVVKEWAIFWKTDPMPPLPMYMFNGIAIATVIILGCILVAQKYESHFIIQSLNKTGQLAFTFYVAHVIIGMGFMIDDESKLGKYSIEFSVIYALIFSFCCIVFATIWLRYKKSGPLEWMMKKLLD